MQIIKIDDYVSNDIIADNIFRDFSSNKLIVKGETGIGGTSAILGITDQFIIVFSPLVGMIHAKEKDRKDHQLFIYKDSKDKWYDFKKRWVNKEPTIVNATPEQLIKLLSTDPIFFMQVLKFNWFVDELQILTEAKYRNGLSAFYDLLFNPNREGKTILSTATPVFHNLDIPPHFRDTMEQFRIELKVKRNKEIIITPVQNYWGFVKEQCEKGNKVVLHTNQIHKIKNLVNFDNLPYKVQTLVGSTLAVKLDKYKGTSVKELDNIKYSMIDPEADIYILSTKYQIGFDFPYDCAVGIICDQGSRVDNKTVNEIVQAYGRCRGKVIEARLFFNTSNYLKSDINKEVQLIKAIPFEEGYLKALQDPIKIINQLLTYPVASLKKTLGKYGFIVKMDTQLSTPVTVSVNMSEQLENLMKQDNIVKLNDFKEVISKIKGDDETFNGFGPKDLLLYSTAYIQGINDSKYLRNLPNLSDLRYDRLLEKAKTYIDANESIYGVKVFDYDDKEQITKFRVPKTKIKRAIQEGVLEEITPINTPIVILNHPRYITNCTHVYFKMAKEIINTLWVIHLVNQEEFTEETRRVIDGFSIVSECLLSDYFAGIKSSIGIDVEELVERLDFKGLKDVHERQYHQLRFGKIFKNTKPKVENQLLKLNLTDDETSQIWAKYDSIKNRLTKAKDGIYSAVKNSTYTIEVQKERHKYYLLYLLSLSISKHSFGFKITKKDNREYNPMTKVTRQLRAYTPYKMKQIDIKSAFPTFLDEMYHTNISQEVYKNIMKANGCDKTKAKKIYNSTLNNHRLTPTQAKNKYLGYGYPLAVAKELASITTKEQGSFFRMMTQIEEKVINDYKFKTRLDDAIRIHDALVVYDMPENEVLMDRMDNYVFEITDL